MQNWSAEQIALLLGGLAAVISALGGWGFFQGRKEAKREGAKPIDYEKLIKDESERICSVFGERCQALQHALEAILGSINQQNQTLAVLMDRTKDL